MSMTQLEVSPRTPAGKGEVRRVRKTGKVPAVAYGKGQPAAAITVEPKDVIAILKSERGQNTVIGMKVAGKDHTVMIKDYSYHPVTRLLEHVDFAFVQLDKEVDVEVPVVGATVPGATAGDGGVGGVDECHGGEPFEGAVDAGAVDAAARDAGGAAAQNG